MTINSASAGLNVGEVSTVVKGGSGSLAGLSASKSRFADVLRYYASIDQLVEQGNLGEASRLLQTGMDFGEFDASPVDYVPGAAAVEYQTLGRLLKSLGEIRSRLPAETLGDLYLRHGALALGMEDLRESRTSLGLALEYLGDRRPAAAAIGAVMLGQSYLNQLAQRDWYPGHPELKDRLLLAMHDHAEQAAGLMQKTQVEAGDDLRSYRLTGAFLAHAVHMLARHDPRIDRELAVKRLNVAGRCFREVEQHYLNGFDPEFVVRENAIEAGASQRMMAHMPGAQYILYLLDRAAMIPGEQDLCMQEAWARAGHNLAASRRNWPPDGVSGEPCSVNEALAMTMKALVLAAAGSGAEDDSWRSGLAGLRDFGRSDIIRSFQLQSRYEAYVNSEL